MIRTLKFMLLFSSAILWTLQSSAGAVEQSFLSQSLIHIKSLSLHDRQELFAREILRAYPTLEDKTYFEKNKESLSQLDLVQVHQNAENAVTVTAQGLKDILIDHVDLQNASCHVNGHHYSMRSGHSLQQDITELNRDIQADARKSLFHFVIPQAEAHPAIEVLAVAILLGFIYFTATHSTQSAKAKSIDKELSSLLKDCQERSPEMDFATSSIKKRYEDLQLNTGVYPSSLPPTTNCKDFATKTYESYKPVTVGKLQSWCEEGKALIQCMNEFRDNPGVRRKAGAPGLPAESPSR